MSGWEATVYGAYHELGRDFNGSPLVSEKRAWMDEQGLVSPDDRAELMTLWREMQAEEAELREAADKKRQETK